MIFWYSLCWHDCEVTDCRIVPVENPLIKMENSMNTEDSVVDPSNAVFYFNIFHSESRDPVCSNDSSRRYALPNHPTLASDICAQNQTVNE